MRDGNPGHTKVADDLKTSTLEIRAKGESDADLRRALEADAEMRGIIEAKERTREEIAEEALEGETRKREKAEAQLGVAMEALTRAAEEAEQREVEEAMIREEEGERSEVQRIAVEWRIEDLKRIVAKSLEAELRQEAGLRQADDILWKEVNTT